MSNIVEYEKTIIEVIRAQDKPDFPLVGILKEQKEEMSLDELEIKLIQFKEIEDFLNTEKWELVEIMFASNGPRPVFRRK